MLLTPIVQHPCAGPGEVEHMPLPSQTMKEGAFVAKLFARARALAGGSRSAHGPLSGLMDSGRTLLRFVFTKFSECPNEFVWLEFAPASPSAARVTGQAISVNGGVSAAQSPYS